MVEAQDTSWMRGVSLACEAGGPDINVHAYILQLRRLLEKHCQGPYSDEVEGFALVFGLMDPLSSTTPRVWIG